MASAFCFNCQVLRQLARCQLITRPIRHNTLAATLLPGTSYERHHSDYNGWKSNNLNTNEHIPYGRMNAQYRPKKDYIVDKGDPDTFGTLKNDWLMQKTLQEIPEEDGDKVEINYVDDRSTRTHLSTKQYADIIKQFIQQKKIGNAIDVLETRMLKEDRMKPESYIYNLLIGACGRVGYTKKAFQLYNQMKKRDLKVSGGTYTGLFNACSLSPYKEEGLKQARKLRDIMITKAYEANQTNYHAMIKAFGWCGDLSTAFCLVDEMIEKKVFVSNETFCFLLQACVTDKDAGFRHALMVWQKMREKRVQHSVYSYNLLLRCVRDCGLGDLPTANKDIWKLVDGAQMNKQKLLAGNNDSSLEENVNLLSIRPSMGNIVAFADVTLPEHRLTLIGGSEGFLAQMSRDGVKPDIKTFTQLLDSIPPTHGAEMVLLDALSNHGVRPDIEFFNMLIKKRSLRYEYAYAREVLQLASMYRLQPDIVTFGVLALGCKTRAAGRQLIKDMDLAGFRPNMEIVGALLRIACYQYNCGYVRELLQVVKREQLLVSALFMDRLHKFLRDVNPTEQDPVNNTLAKRLEDRVFRDSVQELNSFYETWIDEVEQENDKIRPWDQFRKHNDEPSAEDFTVHNVKCKTRI